MTLSAYHVGWISRILLVLALMPILMAARSAPKRSPYVGQEQRAVKSLSESDIDNYLQGRGMGLAKPAELNGYPGPMHVLQMTEELKLTGTQVKQIQTVYDAMRRRAISLGKRIIAQERQLDELFARRRATEKTLQQATASIAELQGQLRQTHLNAHLAMMKALTPAQIARYNRLRGYGHH